MTLFWERIIPQAANGNGGGNGNNINVVRDDTNIGLIVGATLGGLVVLAGVVLLISAIVYYSRRKALQQPQLNLGKTKVKFFSPPIFSLTSFFERCSASSRPIIINNTSVGEYSFCLFFVESTDLGMSNLIPVDLGSSDRKLSSQSLESACVHLTVGCIQSTLIL